MKKSLVVCLMLSLLGLLSLACSFSASTANIQSANMARDEDGTELTTVFEQDETFYVVVELANAPDETQVKAVWIAVDIDGTEPGTQLEEVELTTGSGQVQFNLTNDQLWPVGDYKVDIYLNDELNQTLEFQVEGTVAASTPTAEPTDTPEPEPTDTPEPAPTDTAEPEPTEAVEDTEAVSATLTTYVDPDSYFEIDLPDDWSTEVDTASLIAASQSGDASVAVLGLPGELILSSDELGSYGTDFLNRFFSEDEVTVNESWLENDGSYGYDFTTVNDDATLEGVLFVEQRGLDVFHMVLVTNADMWSAYQETINQIIGSYYITTGDTETFLSAPLPLTSYSDPTELFSMDLPTDWAIDTQDGAVAALAANERTAIFATSLEIETSLADMGVENYVDAFLDDFYEDSDYVVNKVEEVDDIYEVEFDVEEEVGTLFGYLYLQQTEQTLHLLLFQAPDRNWFGMVETFNNVADSYLVNAPDLALSLPPTPLPAVEATPTTSTESEIPAEWFPPAGQATIVLVNDAGADLVFTMDNQEHKLIAGTEKVATYNPGTYTYTASDPRFESYNSECILEAGAIYYWHTDDSSWGSCLKIYPQ